MNINVIQFTYENKFLRKDMAYKTILSRCVYLYQRASLTHLLVKVTDIIARYFIHY